MPILVSDAAAEESLQAYTNPLSIQAKALDDLSNKVLNGAVVSDGNNPFTFLTEFSSNMTANIVNKACECFNGLYPLNAQNATELYRHLSDFDYVGLYATPATTTVELVFDRWFLIDHALDVNTEEGFNQDPAMYSGVYSKIVLPAYSKFTVGDYIFGLMYPIEIRVRKAIKDNQIDYDNSVITVMWDTTKNNPLMPLTSHILEHRDFLQDGQMLTAIEVPIYQFEVENHLENAIGATGFAKRYDYTNRFYAIRVFHFKNGEWNEMAQTFSDTKYDADIPTAIVKVLTDLGKVEVVVPHIYFNAKDASTVIGNRILVKVYTTQGELNVDLSEYRAEQFAASFLLTDTNLIEDDRYSSMLKRIPTVYVLPINTKISSGTNGLTFDQLKDRVKYNNSYTVKITPTDLQNYFNTSGYKFTKELDNITDRVYCAHKILKDSTGAPIASGQGQTYLTSDALNIQTDQNGQLYVPGYSSITVKDHNTFTILPSAVYKYHEDEDRFYLLSDAEKAALDDPDLKTKVANYNANLYTYSPFHTVLTTEANAPIAGTYDMFKPTLKDRVFLWENDRTTIEISIYNAVITKTDTGYKLRISIFKTANIDDVPTRAERSTYDNFRLMLSVEGKDNRQFYQIGEYDPSLKEDGKDVFIFDLTSDYKITPDGEVCLTSLKDGTETIDERPHGGYVNMGYHDYTISLCINSDTLENYVETGFNKSNTVDFDLPYELNDYTLLCRQSFQMKLGESLPLLQNNVTISTADEVYATYQTTQFATYQTTVYERYTVQDAIDGICTVDDVGKLKLDENKKLIPKYVPGDVILSSLYDYSYGPTITLTITENDENGKPAQLLDTLEMNHTSEKKITASSDPSNVFGSIDGDLLVQSKFYKEMNGVYKLVDREAYGTDRIWMHQFNKLEEIFDTSSFELAISLDDDAITGTFYSSNSQEVKNAIEGIDPLQEINTEARDYDRKWFLLTDDRASFNFSTYTGYVIEYGYSGTSESGAVKSWVLNYYYFDTDEEGDPVSQCITIYESMDLPASETHPNPMTDEYREILSHDPYVKGYVSKYYTIQYGFGTHTTLKLGLEGEEPFYTAHCVTEESDRVIPRYEPWDVIWKSTNVEVTDLPVITNLVATDIDHKVSVMDALEYIDKTMAPVTYGSFILYRNLLNAEEQDDPDYTYALLEDPLLKETSGYENERYMFVAVGLCDDDRPVSQFNYIDYAPGYGDDTGVDLELGTTTAQGAIYYRDIEMTHFDYEKAGFTRDNVVRICRDWQVYRADGKTDTWIYDKLISTYSTGPNKVNVPLTHSLLSKIVSSTTSCYFSPWIKLVTCSSKSALDDYVEHHTDGIGAGYIGLIEEVDRSPYGESTVKYINILSKITKRIEQEDSVYEEDVFCVNPDMLSWNEVDKWPWEYTTPWIKLEDCTVADVGIAYNQSISSSKVLYGPDTVKTDDEGNPIVATPRTLMYGVDMIHCDYKLSLSEDAEYSNYMEDIRDLLRAYFSELKSITPSLLARTKLYFSPIRTFGHAEFKGSNGSIRSLPVQFSAELGLHIEAYVKASTLSKQTIRSVILTLIDKDMKDGTINLAALAKDIVKELSDNVLYVDVLGLNNDRTQQTMIPVREDTYPQLKQILVLYDDGTIHVDRDLELDWYVIS